MSDTRYTKLLDVSMLVMLCALALVICWLIWQGYAEYSINHTGAPWLGYFLSGGK